MGWHMARKAGGSEEIETAKKLLKTAKTADELRKAQSVLLPLMLGLSIDQTAKAIGRTKGATCTMRTRFSKIASGKMATPQSKRKLRNRAKTSLEREKQILDKVLHTAAHGGIVVIPQIKPAIEAELGKPLSLSSVYRMLGRHGWRKLAPDTQHPQGDPNRREEWKKNFPLS
jgi:transposase